MRVLLFDTETTGLPKTREPATRGPNNWPHLVSIAWIILENDKIIKERYAVIKPKWSIDAESVKIHGITEEKAKQIGEDLQIVINEFLSETSDSLIAHNMNFDYNVIINAIVWDLKMKFPTFPKLICTMESMRSICKMPSLSAFRDYKLPKLSELYKFVLNKEPENKELHNSLYDVKILTEIVLKCDTLKRIIGLPIIPVAVIQNDSGTKRSKILHI